MDLLQTVLNAGDGAAVAELGRNFGLDQGQTAAAVGQLLPALAAGLSRNTAQPGGLEGLLGALAGGRHERYLDDPASMLDASTVQEGNGILGHVLGSKDVSRQVAAHASARTGIGADVLKQMLPMVAAMAMGALSRQTAGSRMGGPAAAQPGVLGMLAPLLDSNKDGSVADDVMGMLGKFRGPASR
jgi:hypothetical protein